MKRLMCIILAFTMLASFGTVASASTNSEAMARVLASVKERIGNTDEYDIFRSSENTYDKKTFYEFEWSMSKDGAKSLYVTASASGIITSYSYYDEDMYNTFDDTRGTMSRKNTDEVLAAAQEKLNALNPDICHSLKVVSTDGFESLYSRIYRFEVKRVENGVEVYGDGGSITMASDGSTLTDFNINYTEGVAFKDAAGVIGKDEARAAFEKNIGLKLRYETTYDSGERKVRLVYRPDCGENEFIDAFTGEKTEINDAYRAYNEKNAGMGKSEEAADSSGFTPAESAHLEEIDGLIGAAEAENLVYSNKVLNVSKNLKLTNITRSRGYGDDGKVLYQMRFSSENKDEVGLYENAWVTMDAKTGEIIHYSYNNNTNEEKKISPEKANDIAQNAAEVLSGSKFAEFRADENCGDGYYSYTRYVNDIPVSYDSINVSISLNDGSIDYYSINYSEDEFPSPKDAVTVQAAAEVLFANVDYSLSYVPNYGETSVPTEFKLVYKFDDRSECAVDALSGKIDTREGREKISYNDIDSHYAKDAILSLAKYGIGFESEGFVPQKAITQKEYLAFVCEAVLHSNNIIIGEKTDYDYIYRTAKRNGIIKDGEINRDAPVTRQMASVFMVRALGFAAVAELDIYKTNFADVGEYVGYISILSGMKILSGDGSGNFNPSGVLTRGDAAIVLMRTLTR